MVANLRRLAEQEEAIALAIDALETGTFHHPNGREDELGVVRLSLAQAGLLAHLATSCPRPLSLEVGFGMGSSAAVILGSRRLAGRPFGHLIYDPFGLGGGRGSVVESYLTDRFPREMFRRVKKRSEIGLGKLFDSKGAGSVGLAFIDGGHRFENVMADFMLSDLLCCVGGHIVLDDAQYPAIEAVVRYVERNRPDYAVADLAVPNCTVLKRITTDKRDWDDFKPFDVPQREDWTPAPGSLPGNPTAP